MRKSLYLLGVLCLVSSSAHANLCPQPAQQMAGIPGLELPWIELSAASTCNAEAECGDMADYGRSGTISCTDTTDPAECTAQDRNCSIGNSGYVMCNGIRTACGFSCMCVPGQSRWVTSGCCCDFAVPRQQSLEQLCVNGYWVFTGQRTCANQCTGSCTITE